MRVWALLAALVCAACGGGGGGPAPAAAPQAALGDPVAGLDAATLARFLQGRAMFEHRFTRAEGHGPDFNTSSCKSCHGIPVTGGSSPLYRNFSIVSNISGGRMVSVLEGGEFVAKNFSYDRRARESIPPNAQVVAQRNSPPLFGIGLFESIPDADILANADPDDADGDGISGRPNFDDTGLGRFGFKAQESDVEDFVAAPLKNHMGITSFPLSSAGLAQVILPGSRRADDDNVPEPEISIEDLFALVTYVRLLAPPPRGTLDAAGRRGEQAFEAFGCAKCHVPNIVRDGEPLFAYSDFLLHEMGPELADGVRMGVATASEFRTQPLWGLRHTAPFLHNGRASTIDEAIRLHGGEAAASRDAYEAAPAGERADLLRFLETR